MKVFGKTAAALSALSLIFMAGACGGGEAVETTAASTAAASTVPASTVPASTAAASTTTASGTTEKSPETTKKKPATTKKKPATTKKKPATTKKKPAATEPDRLPPGYQIKETAYAEDLKYGVVRKTVVASYYMELEDGTELVLREKTTERFNRAGYAATYDELLAAGRENRKKYLDEINEILRIINGYRAEKGIAALEPDEELMEIAGARAEEIAWSGRHSHTRPNGEFFSSIMREAGLNRGFAGENIGWGYPDAGAVCNNWRESEKHYENIMNPQFKKTGIGVAKDPDSDGELCWTQLFLD